MSVKLFARCERSVILIRFVKKSYSLGANFHTKFNFFYEIPGQDFDGFAKELIFLEIWGVKQ